MALVHMRVRLELDFNFYIEISIKNINFKTGYYSVLFVVFLIHLLIELVQCLAIRNPVLTGRAWSKSGYWKSPVIQHRWFDPL